MFGFGLDKKTITILVVVMVILKIISKGTEGMVDVLLLLPAVLVAITFHEFAHAFAADKLGDDTPRTQGRLNLNPMSHIDPIGFAFLLTAGFGWGKPVKINPRNFDHKNSMSKAEAIVSVAGPIMNFLLALLFLIIMYVILIFDKTVFTSIGSYLMGYSLSSIGTTGVLYVVLYYGVIINIALGVFNLIPLPPLDGSKILTHFLPYKAKQWFYNNEQLFYILFLLLWISGLSSIIVDPIFGIVFDGMNWLVGSAFGLFM